MPHHFTRRYDGHTIHIETGPAPDGSYYRSYFITPIGAGSTVVHKVERDDDMTFDSSSSAVESAVLKARAWIDDQSK
jgi:hypothetical protein